MNHLQLLHILQMGHDDVKTTNLLIDAYWNIQVLGSAGKAQVENHRLSPHLPPE